MSTQDNKRIQDTLNKQDPDGNYLYDDNQLRALAVQLAVGMAQKGQDLDMTDDVNALFADVAEGAGVESKEDDALSDKVAAFADANQSKALMVSLEALMKSISFDRSSARGRQGRKVLGTKRNLGPLTASANTPGIRAIDFIRAHAPRR